MSMKCPWKPDFEQMAAVLARKTPSRPVLFELFYNDGLIRRVSGMDWTPGDSLGHDLALIKANEKLGYDYALVRGSDFDFPCHKRRAHQTVSLNDAPMIEDRASFDRYPWPDPDDFPIDRLDTLAAALPDGMRLMVWSNDGLLELIIKLVGFDNLCLLLSDVMPLVEDIFAECGRRFVRYFETCLNHPAVSVVVSSDDWGFKTQTMLSLQHMRKLLFPWQKELCAKAHAAGKYTLLHSCCYMKDIWDDIIDMGFDAKHSYEDVIQPVEDVYESLAGRIAVLGGIDLDFLIRSDEAAIAKRASGMLDRAATRGGYALGTGNSVPDYVADDTFFAMLAAGYERT